MLSERIVDAPQPATTARRARKPRPRMYESGPRLDIHEAVAEIVAGRYVFLGRRPCHPAWLASVPLHEIHAMTIHPSRLRRAILTQYGRAVMEARALMYDDKAV